MTILQRTPALLAAAFALLIFVAPHVYADERIEECRAAVLGSDALLERAQKGDSVAQRVFAERHAQDIKAAAGLDGEDDAVDTYLQTRMRHFMGAGKPARIGQPADFKAWLAHFAADVEQRWTLRERAIAGDQEALGMLLDEHEPAIRAAIRKKLVARQYLQEAYVEEIAQNVYAKVLSEVGTDAFYNPARGTEFSTWVTLVATTQTIDFLRKHKRYLEAEHVPVEDYHSVEPDTHLDQMIRAQQAEWIREEVRNMEPHYFEVFELVIVKKLTHKKAAEQLGVAESTVSNRMTRLRDRLCERAALAFPDLSCGTLLPG